MLWASGRATTGEELVRLGEMDPDPSVAAFRKSADEFKAAGVGPVVDKDIALQLDRELQPDPPHWFEFIYAAIYRTTSDVAHYGLGTALAGYGRKRDPRDADTRAFDELDEPGAAQALGLAVVALGALLVYSEPILGHGLAAEASEIVGRRHLEPDNDE